MLVRASFPSRSSLSYRMVASLADALQLCLSLLQKLLCRWHSDTIFFMDALSPVLLVLAERILCCCISCYLCRYFAAISAFVADTLPLPLHVLSQRKHRHRGLFSSEYFAVVVALVFHGGCFTAKVALALSLADTLLPLLVFPKWMLHHRVFATP